MVETAQKAGVEHIVSVFDARMARIFRSIDCQFEQLGTPVRIGKTMTYAGLFDMSRDMRSRLGAAGNFRKPVLADIALPLRPATGHMANAE
jgi:acyl homoserine lactone synthase